MTRSPASSLRRAVSFAAVAFVPAWLLAQTQDLPPAGAFAMKASPIVAAPETPYDTKVEIWAAGSTYKVSFHDGMAFLPYVGPTLPHQPLRWRTVSVRAGERELLASASRPAPRHTDFRCEYDLGAVVECYDVRDGGLEQSFVVRERPPAGDLVVVGEITTPLVLPATAAAHGPVSLRLPGGRGVIDYGAAFVVDADGVRTPITTATEGNRIVLRVAAATVAAARFPLVVDPLIATSVQLGVGLDAKDVDVLHETMTAVGTQARVWYTWSFEFAAGDHDLRLWRVGTNWSGTAFEVFRAIGFGNTRRGSLGLAGAVSRVVLAFDGDWSFAHSVFVHPHDTSDTSLGISLYVVPGPGGTSDWRPEVGGRLETLGSKVLIVFQRDAAFPLANTDTSTVCATVFDATPPLPSFPVQPFVVLPLANTDQERCVVNQSAAGPEWLVAFQQRRNAFVNDLWSIETLEVDVNGNVVDTGLDTAQGSSSSLHSLHPQIAGTFGRYLLTYGTRAFEPANPKPASVEASALFAQRIDWDHSSDTGSLPHPEVTLQSVPGNVLTNGGIAFDVVSQSHWCQGYQNAALARYRVSKLGYTGNVLEQLSINLQVGGAPEAIAVGFVKDLRQFPIVYADNLATGGLVLGTTMNYTHAAMPVLSGLACGSGVWADVEATGNRQQLGSEDMPVHLTNAPADTFALLIASLSPINADGALIGAPGCTILPDLAVGFVDFFFAPIVGGEASLTFDLPEALGPFPLYLQWAYSAPGGNPLGFLFSEGLTLDVDR